MQTKLVRIWSYGLIVAAFSGLTAGTAVARDLVVALKTEPSSMDPHYHALTPNNQFAQTLFEGLVRGSPDLVPEPLLAESWTSEGNTWTFKLRKGVKFSDGSPFTADDVVYTYARVPKVPNSPSPFTIYLQGIEKVEAVDPLTVRITTKQPYPLLANNLANVPIMSSKAAAGSTAPEGKTTAELNSGNGLVGTGPYKFVSWQRGAEIVLDRNPNYWGKKPVFDKITYRPLSSAAARVAALLSGGVDMIEDPPTDDLANLKKNTALNVVEKPSARVIYVALDQFGEKTPGIIGTAKNPLLDKRVRQALSLAIDRNALVERIMGGVAKPAAQLLPYPMQGASAKLVEPEKPDVEKAKALLKEAGYGNGFAIQLGAPNGRYINDSRVAQTIASMWSRIGVKTSVEAAAPPVFFKNRDSYAYSAYLAGWAVSTGEMSNALNSLLVTPNPALGIGTTNRSRYSNPAMDKLVAEASTIMDDKARSAKLAEASEVAMADYAMLPIHFELSTWAMKKDLDYKGRADQMTLVQDVTTK
jgi:peptide/nickel transport system substrate-binding protein